MIVFVGSWCGSTIAEAIGAMDQWTFAINSVSILITYAAFRAVLTLWRSQRQ